MLPGTATTIDIAVRDANGLPVEGEAIVWAVDEGVLALTGYEATDPLRALLTWHRWTDATLEETREMYGENWTIGFTVAALIAHQAHHRGQMTVLMRQAGLAVPGVYGPAREEWAAMGMPALE